MKLINNDCILAMKEMPDGSVDSIVTDPPYELGFMGKSWDSTGIAFNVEVWREALRVLKPGGHILAFSGSRTYHRMAVAIEDAGFEIRDQIMWVYGSGFPKSHNVSKAIDKAAGAEREVVGERTQRANSKNSLIPMNTSAREVEHITAPTTDSAKQWNGWGTALKPAHEPIVLARKPFPKGYTVAKNVLEFGTGGLNIESARVPSDDGFEKAWDKPVSTNISADGGKYISEGARHIVDLGDYRPSGRFPANFIHDGSDEVVGLFPNTAGNHGGRIATSEFEFGAGDGCKISATNAKQDFGSAARFFYCAKASKRDRNEGLDGFKEKQTLGGGGLTAGLREDGSYETGGAGGAYDSIKSKQSNHHPTVKPTDLMRYLCRLITPPNGIILDPFMGSGSTGKAAILEGFDFIGIDQSAEYVEISRARIAFAVENKNEELPI